MDFKQVYNTYYVQIFKFCYRFIGDQEISKDITQEVFMKLYLLNDKNHVPQNLKAWLYKVAGNICINGIKGKKRKEEVIKMLNGPVMERSNPESILINTEKRKLVQSAMAGIKPVHRVLLLMYQDGLSYKEMSEATGIPLNSVGKTLWRSIEKITATVKSVENER